MSGTWIALLFGVAVSGVLLLKVGGGYFERKSGKTKPVAAAAVLIGFALLILFLVTTLIVRIQHLFR